MEIKHQLMSLILLATLAAAPAFSQEYEFKGGFPTPETARRVQDEQDYQRAIHAYRFFYPTVSMEGTFQGHRDAGAEDNKNAMILAGGPRHVLFTGNSDTPYMGAVLNLKQAGPMVIELPAGSYLGVINDHHFRCVHDLGLPGPDAGKGGKHLILPPDYQGEVPAGYYTARANTHLVLLAGRARCRPAVTCKARSRPNAGSRFIPSRNRPTHPFHVPGHDRPENRCHPPALGGQPSILGEAAQGPARRAGRGGVPSDVRHARRARHRAGQAVRAGRAHEGDPGAAAKAGRDQMLVAGFGSSRPDRFVWTDRKWEWAALRYENGDFELPTGIDVEARDRWFSQAVGASPKMFLRTAGAGSLYWLGLRDKDGAYLDGGKTYKLSVPQPVPQKLFWSVTVYDSGTRSQIQTDQDKAALRSLVELKEYVSKVLTCYSL